MKYDNYNIIFLDIDGVLNCETFFTNREVKYDESKTHAQNNICPKRMNWLNKLCEDINAVVVMSSTWRLNRTTEEIQELMNSCGGTFKIISRTERTSHAVRGVEIKQWLDKNIEAYHGDFLRYVIIDDDSDMLLNQANHFFKTDFYSGLTPNICYKIKRYFNLLRNVSINDE